MKKRLYGGLAALAIGLTMLVPMTAGAKGQSACVVVKQGKLNLQLGYSPNGPRDCTRLP